MQQNTPFRAVPREELEVGGAVVIKGANGDEVAFVQFDEDAAFIVKACNSYEQLVEALTLVGFSAGYQYMTYETRELISAALAAAGAE